MWVSLLCKKTSLVWGICLKRKAKITFFNYPHIHTPLFLPCWSSWNETDGVSHLAKKTTASVFTDEMKAEKSGKSRKEEKKTLFQLQTNPPGEILFQCTLHFVALMPALNCFGTCHRYWWNSFSLQRTFPFIPFPLYPLFPPSSFHLFPKTPFRFVWYVVWPCIWKKKNIQGLWAIWFLNSCNMSPVNCTSTRSLPVGLHYHYSQTLKSLKYWSCD